MALSDALIFVSKTLRQFELRVKLKLWLLENHYWFDIAKRFQLVRACV
jgi:hypothetical protein